MKSYKSLLVINDACVRYMRIVDARNPALLGQERKMPQPVRPSGDVTLPLSEYNHLVTWRTNPEKAGSTAASLRAQAR